MNYIFIAFVAYLSTTMPDGVVCELTETEIHGYHFHTYFLQNNEQSTKEALKFREAIHCQIQSGNMENCRLNHVNYGPRGPHPIGSYETCCNKTSLSRAMSFFMQNHGNLSIFLHPLTRYEVLDHTERSVFLGPRYPLDISVLSPDLGDKLDLCLPLENHAVLQNSISEESRRTEEEEILSVMLI